MAAPTITIHERTKLAGLFAIFADVTVGTYATNGVSVPAASLGLAQVKAAFCETASGYMFQYDYTTQKLKAMYPRAAVTGTLAVATPVLTHAGAAVDAHSGAAVNAHSGAAVDAHSGAAVGAHAAGATPVTSDAATMAAHAVTQPTAHVVTQPAAHSVTQPTAHVVTQPSDHAVGGACTLSGNAAVAAAAGGEVVNEANMDAITVRCMFVGT